MVTKYVDVDGKWGILLNYHFDETDWDDISALLHSFGMNERNINKSLNILSSYNTGMCISNEDLRMSAIFISKATSPSEWYSTAIHELKHCADAIIMYYDVDWAGEDAAYLSGYLFKRVVEEIAEPCYD